MVSDSMRRGPGRPSAASRDSVEQIALALMLRDGYDAVSVDSIAAAAGIGRTTFFRYFGSKPAVIWGAFDQTLAALGEDLQMQSGAADVLDGVCRAIVSSTRSALYSSEVWLERFQLLDSHPSLHAEAYEHWEGWRRILAQHIARATSEEPSAPGPMAIAGACHGVFLAELRSPLNSGDERDALLDRLDANLTLVCSALRSLASPLRYRPIVKIHGRN